MMTLRTPIFLLIVAVAALAFPPSAAGGRGHPVVTRRTVHHAGGDTDRLRVRVVRRLRVGSNGEDLTYVASGRHRGLVAAMNGWDVVAAGSGNRRPRTLFDVRGLGLGIDAPRGIAYVASQHRFYFGASNPEQTDRLFVTDEDGRALPALPLTYPAGVDPLTDILQFEGLSYIPATSARFPDHLVAITIRLPDFQGVIEIIRFERDGRRIVGGTVVGEIAFDPTSPFHTWISAVEYAADPDRLLIAGASVFAFDGTFHENELYEVGFDGAVAGPVAKLDGLSVIEGLASLPDGRIACSDYRLASVPVLRPDFTASGEEIDLQVGFGVSTPHGMTWNPETNEFVAASASAVSGLQQVTAFTLHASHAFTASDPRLLFPGDVAFVPGEGGAPGRVAVANRTSAFRGIFLYDADGQYLTRIRTRGVILPAANSVPGWLAALPDGEFAYSSASLFPTVEIVTGGDPDPTDPTAVLAREIRRIVLDGAETPEHPAQVGTGLAFTDRAGGVLMSGNTFYDLTGARLGSFAVADLGLEYIDGATFISTGPYAGAWAAVERESSTLVIFTLRR